ncbi:MAG: hypothetical protein QM692_12370 [Thermomicrobiales bacterium]
MDPISFDALARALGATSTRLVQTASQRRTLAKLLGVALAAPPLSGLVAVLGDADEATAKKQDKVHKPRKYKQKRKFCLDGKQVKTRRKRRIRRWKRRGATRGKCPGGSCTPVCTGCGGGDDGCGGTCPGCAAGSMCVGGACTPCTVTCSDTPALCGVALQTALTTGGDVYVCPGRYAGLFTVAGDETTITGAGDGDDSATSTILDGQSAGAVFTIDSGLTTTFSRVRITGGGGMFTIGGAISAPAGGNTLIVRNSTLIGNSGASGGAIFLDGALELTDSRVLNNSAGNIGGGINLSNVSSGTVSHTITNTTFSENSASNEAGAVYIASGSGVLTGVVMDQNTAGDVGGLLYSTGSASHILTMDATSAATNNTATGGLVAASGLRKTGAGSFTVAAGATVSGNTPTPQCLGVTGC